MNKPINPVLPAQAKPRGTAMILAVVMLIFTTSLMIAMMESSHRNLKSADTYAEQETAYYAAQGAVNMVVSDIWGGYKYRADVLSATKNFSISLGTSIPPLNISTIPTSPAIDTAIADSSTASIQSWDRWCGKRLGPATITRVRLTRRNEGIPSGAVATVTPLYVQLMVEAEITTDAGVQANFVRSFRFSDSVESKAPDYAILTNNITCSICHLKVQNAMKNWSKLDDITTGEDNIKTKAKVGTLQLLALRPGSAESTIEGNLFQRGRFEDEFSGAAYTTSTLTGSTFKCVQAQDSSSVKLQTSAGYTNYTTKTAFSTSGLDANGVPSSINDTAYMNYPTNPLKMNMGELPTSFPNPFADMTGDRRIDTSDIAQTQAKDVLNGKVGGTLSASVAFTVPKTSGVPADTVYNYAGLPGQTGGPSATPLSVTESMSGSNVVLVGTYANPIKINGKVIIDGDVIIKGYVEGTGEIWASGNVYVPNDLQYKNQTVTQTIDGVTATREVFGVSQTQDTNTDGSLKYDGTDPVTGLPIPVYKKNLLGLVGGKNIVMGDYLSSVNHWDSGRSDFIDSRNFGIPEPGQKVVSASTVDSGLQADSTNNGYNTNFAPFVMEELSFFNRDELTKAMPKVLASSGDPESAAKYTKTNPLYDSTYVPRLYTMYKNQKKADGTLDTTTYGNTKGTTPIPIYTNKDSTWVDSKQWWNNTQDPHTYSKMRQLNELPSVAINSALPLATAADPAAIENTNKAVVLNLHPEWVPPKTMLNLLMKEEQARTTNVPRRVDGLLYTNNALFAIERKQTMKYTGTYDPVTQTWAGGSWSKVATKSGGSMQINGAIVSPDMGLLVTGGTKTSSTWKEGYSATYNGSTKYYERKALTVNYDARVKDLLKITEKNSDWSYKSCGSARNPGPIK